jgi:hypothetical protein
MKRSVREVLAEGRDLKHPMRKSRPKAERTTNQIHDHDWKPDQ